MPNKLYDYADPDHPLLQGTETGAGLGGEIGPGNAYDALMSYVRRVMATDPVATQKALADQAAAERQRSYDMGYADPVTGLPTAKGAADIAGQWGRGVMMGTTAPGEAPGITVYHGSPHSFDRFDLGKIGTGEGAQAYGHGLYFAENEGVARTYKSAGQPSYLGADRISAAQQLLKDTGGDRAAALNLADERMRSTTKYSEGKLWQDVVNNFDDLVGKTPGSMYEVNIAADPEHFLHWDKPLSEQSPQARDAISQLAARGGMTGDLDKWNTAGDLFKTLEGRIGPARTTEILRDAGIPGIRYYDAGSRSAGEGSHNYVVFDDATLDILRKYGIAGLIAGGGAAASGNALDQGSDNAQ